jgi:hypothetical protein
MQYEHDTKSGKHMGSPKNEKRIGRGTSITSFTNKLQENTNEILRRPHSTITIDGGPHTFWWFVFALCVDQASSNN